MVSTYKLSIIIPTRNRQVYAEAATRQILGISPCIQVVVQDNSDNDELCLRLSDIIDGSRVVYNYTNTPIPVVENYSMGIELSSGEFVCAIGDDDGVLPNIIQCVDWMKKNDIDVVSPSRKSSYVWPTERSSGCLCVDEISGETYVCDTRQAVVQLLKNGGQGYLKLDLAGTYHCIVKRDVLEKVKAITGKFYDGYSPDIYSATCISLIENIKCVKVDFPVTLPGACPKSTTAEGAQHKAAGALETAPHLNGKKDYMWNHLVPYYYSSETVWAETMLHAMEDMGFKEWIDKYFDDTELVSKLYWNNASQRNEIESVLSQEQYSKVTRNPPHSERRNLLLKIWSTAGKCIKGNYVRVYRIENIELAVSRHVKHLNKKRFALMWNAIIKKQI